MLHPLLLILSSLRPRHYSSNISWFVGFVLLALNPAALPWIALQRIVTSGQDDVASRHNFRLFYTSTKIKVKNPKFMKVCKVAKTVGPKYYPSSSSQKSFSYRYFLSCFRKTSFCLCFVTPIRIAFSWSSINSGYASIFSSKSSFQRITFFPGPPTLR